MTDAEIMKGVKLCNGDLGNCKECPFDSIGKTCGIELAKAEIGLIERLQAENAALRERLGNAVELKVKVGDKIYCIHGMSDPIIIEWQVDEIRTTRAAAEARLAELKGGAK